MGLNHDWLALTNGQEDQYARKNCNNDHNGVNDADHDDDGADSEEALNCDDGDDGYLVG